MLGQQPTPERLQLAGHWGKTSQYNNWYKEVKNTCIQRRCVSLIPGPVCAGPGQQPLKVGRWSLWAIRVSWEQHRALCASSASKACAAADPGGPGQVNYRPLSRPPAPPQACPFASMASVACEDGDEGQAALLPVQGEGPSVFDWDSSGGPSV